KDDEVRAAVKGALEALAYSGRVSVGDAKGVIDLVLRPAVEAIREMIFKEEEILFPMCLEKLTDAEWYAIARQSPAIGFCIYDPVEDWQPEGPAAETETASPAAPDRLQFPSGSLSPVEIQTILNTIPFDLTFVGADDTVRYFTQGRERIFERNRAIIGRKVQMCHPPGSVHIVQRIIDDFKAGRADRAPFWIELHGKFIHIEYFAVRDEHGTYLGTLEVSQDLTGKRALTGQKRLLSYE
nr:PAS domain-containing protein [candidate division Zixibacteria bacterium]